MHKCNHRIPKKLPYGATKGKYWCKACDADLVSEWRDKPIKKKIRQQTKKLIKKEL